MPTEAARLRKRRKRQAQSARKTANVSLEVRKEVNNMQRTIRKNPNTAVKVVGPIIPSVRGQGGFFTDVKDYFTKPGEGGGPSRANGLMRSGATAIGNAIMPGLGGVLGEAGSWLSRTLGFGRYSVKRNSLLDTSAWGNVETAPYVRRPPSFGTIAQGSDIEICHEEYIQDVISNTGFSTVNFLNNPGNPQAFPFLSQLATYFEMFEWVGLMYQYKTTSSMATSTVSGAMGTICIATDYDCTDETFNSKREMENAEYASNAAPYQTFLHPIECDPRRSNLMNKTSYVLPGVTTVVQAQTVNGFTVDPHTFVPSVTTLASIGNAASGQALGELWVSYHVRLSRPILYNAISTAQIFTQHMYGLVASNNTGYTNTFNNCNGGTPFDVTFTGTGTSAQWNIANTTNKYVGRYMVVVGASLSGTPSVSASGINFGTTGAAVLNSLSVNNSLQTSCQSFNVSEAGSEYAGNTSMATSWTIVTFNGPGSLILPIPSSNGSAGYDMYIMPFNSLLTYAKKQSQRIDELEAALQKLILANSKNVVVCEE